MSPGGGNAARSNPGDLSHSAVLDLLAEYATLIARGHPPEATFPAVARHLAACDDCQGDLDELLELVLPVFLGEAEPAPAYPTPNLEFLRREREAAPVPPDQEPLGRLLVRFSQRLLDSLRPPSLAGALRGQLLYSYTPDAEPTVGLTVTVEVFAEEAATQTASVRVMVEVAGRDALAQEGTAVTLRADAQTWQDETDAIGCAEFNAVPLDALPQLEIEVVPLPQT